MDGPQNVIQGFEGYNEIPDKDQPENAPWPEDWEGAMGAVFSLILGVPDAQKPYPLRLNLDMLRWYRETMHPRNYMNTSYYELWLLAVCFYLSQSGSGGITKEQLTGGGGALPIVSPQELDRAGDIRGIGIHQAVPGFSKPDKDGKFSSTEYTEGKASEPKYQAGQRVATVLQASAGHTREYQYFRGRPGVIDAVYPVAVPDPKKGTGSGSTNPGTPTSRRAGFRSTTSRSTACATRQPTSGAPTMQSRTPPSTQMPGRPTSRRREPRNEPGTREDTRPGGRGRRLRNRSSDAVVARRGPPTVQRLLGG